MDFARKQLEKFGWKEGNGLGKDSQGIVTAIKPSLKVGKEGMGYDLSKELVDTWWTRAYDDSLKRINIETDNENSETVGVSLNEDDEDNNGNIESSLISGASERPFLKLKKRMMKASFPTFSKGATLSNGEMLLVNKGDTNSEESTSDNKTELPKSLTDEELFKACGGRTAHKAARFGLKLNGKLARIAAQEEATKKLISSTKANVELDNPKDAVDSPLELEIVTKPKKKKKDKKKQKLDSDNPEQQEEQTRNPNPESSEVCPTDSITFTPLHRPEDDCPCPDEKKKKRKKHKKRKYESLINETLDEPEVNHLDEYGNDETHQAISNDTGDDDGVLKKSKKKKSKKHKRSKKEGLVYDTL